ncbi:MULTISPECIES: intradiol ring-cleavage dioxygenase [unclassified Actinopolyspora]|uniref:intradiol ring-cleavage dioxygenase n=1 Tax=unclassified Actinopolyspora TaxID=2639451 RepID=UPI0013F5E97B|nr:MULTISPECIES: intradiol ring-cleavage dioxygenase [unclassified Actinopolyspora]NHD15769.1 intradiol ring-cleavage dioxygenase [Actinopolyspora sp. BKK2]NHE75017.1 intradiol ring-cleavage dioxygenase [Actinopolyspora sp. BKK1]
MTEHQSAENTDPASNSSPDQHGTTRRGVLAAFGGLGLGTAVAGLGAPATAATGRNDSATITPSCVLAPEQMEGPYYLDYRILRRDITEDRQGIGLLLDIVVVDATSCLPLKDIAVDVWHCDASGVYSSYTEYDDGQLPPLDENGHAEPTDDTTWLRGVQLTDHRGVAGFRSVVPGWYRGRTVHIHVKTITGGHREDGTWEGGHTSHTGQLYFPAEFNERLARTAPYSDNTIPRTTNEQDLLYTTDDEGPMTQLELGRTPPWYPRETVRGTVVLGIDPAATPPPEGLPESGSR